MTEENTQPESESTEAPDATETTDQAPTSTFELSDELLEKLTASITERLTASKDEEENTDEETEEDTSDEKDDKASEPSPKIKKLNKENQTLRQRAKEAEEKLLKIEVAIASGLPANLAQRLQGATKEELEKDAQALAELAGIKTINPNAQPTDGQPRAKKVNQADAESLSDIGARMFNR